MDLDRREYVVGQSVEVAPIVPAVVADQRADLVPLSDQEFDEVAADEPTRLPSPGPACPSLHPFLILRLGAIILLRTGVIVRIFPPSTT